jgi:hypothetical protein
VVGLASAATNWMAFPLVVGADLPARLRAIRCPTLLVTDTGEDLYEATRRCRALRPDFAYAELPGGTLGSARGGPARFPRRRTDHYERRPRGREEVA